MKALILTASVLALSTLPAVSPALAQQAKENPIIRVATGSEGERYFALCQAAAQQMARTADVQCIETGGSYENAGLLADGKADAALVQANVPQFWEADNRRKLDVTPLSETHKEVAHLVCDKNAKIGDMEGLVARKGAVVAIGGDNSGHNVSWLQMAKVMPELAKVKTVSIGGFEAIAKLANGSGDLTCAFMTAGVGGQTMTDANQRSNGRLALAETWDDRFAKIVDKKGAPIFSEAEIAEGTYSKLQFGTFSTSYDAAAVPALLVVSDAFLADNSALANRLDRAFTQAANQR